MYQRRFVAAALTIAFASALTAQKPSSRPATVDDLMKMRSIVDVLISPDGQRVAYVTSTPNLATNEHDGALFVVPAATARLATRRVPALLACGVLVAAIDGAVGLYVAYWLDLPPGPAVAVAAAAVYAVVALASVTVRWVR